MRLAFLACAVATVAACGGGNAAPDADEGLACVEAKRGEDYHIGLEHPGAKGQLDFSLMSAMSFRLRGLPRCGRCVPRRRVTGG